MKMIYLTALVIVSSSLHGMKQELIIDDLSGLVSAKDYRSLIRRENLQNRTNLQEGVLSSAHEAQSGSESDYVSSSEGSIVQLRFTRSIEYDSDEESQIKSSSEHAEVDSPKKNKGTLAVGVAAAAVLAAGTYLASRFFRAEPTKENERKLVIKFEDGSIKTITMNIEELQYFGIFSQDLVAGKDVSQKQPLEIHITEQEFITLLRYVGMLIAQKTPELEALLDAECDIYQVISLLKIAERLVMKELLEVLSVVFVRKIKKARMKHFTAASTIVGNANFSDSLQNSLKELIYPQEDRNHFISLVHVTKNCKDLLCMKQLGADHYYVVAKSNGKFRFELYNATTYTLVDAFEFPDEIKEALFSLNELVITTTCRAYFIDLKTGNFTSTLGAHDPKTNSFWGCVNSANKPVLVLGLTNQSVIIDSMTQRIYYLNNGDIGSISMRFSENGSTFAVLGKSGQVNFWDSEVMKLQGKVNSEKIPTLLSATGPSDFLTCNDEGALEIWSCDGKPKGSVELGGRILCFDPVGNRCIITRGELTYLAELNKETLALSRQQLPVNGPVIKAAFSSRGSNLALLLEDNSVECYSVANQEKIISLSSKKKVQDIWFNQTEHLIVAHEGGYTAWCLLDHQLTYLRNPQNLSEALLYAHFRQLLAKDEVTLVELSQQLIKGKEEGIKALMGAIW